MPTHTVHVGSESRELPIVNVGPVSVALLNLLGDTRLTEAAAEVLAARVPAGVEVLVTPEVKSVPLAHAISVRTGLPYVVVRKTHKPYMVGPISRTVNSITTGKPQELADVDARVVATLVVFTEGEARDDVVAIGHLPLYPAEAGA